MRPRNIAVYLVAVLHAMDVGPEVAAALGQHESISSRAPAVDSQVSDTHFVHPSESRLLRGEASAFEQAGGGPTLELSFVEVVEDLAKFCGEKIKRLVKPNTTPDYVAGLLHLPPGAVMSNYNKMTFHDDAIYVHALLHSGDSGARVDVLRKFENIHEAHTAAVKAKGA